MLSLSCCAGFSLLAMSRGYSLIAVRRFPVVVSLFVELGLQGMWASVVVLRWPFLK